MAMLDIEVAYATSLQQWIIPLCVSVGTTVKQAIDQSRLLEKCPDINLGQQKVGIFSRIVELHTLVQQGDRVEIYRPLLIDPITRRFQRVKIQRKKSR